MRKKESAKKSDEEKFIRAGKEIGGPGAPYWPQLYQAYRGFSPELQRGLLESMEWVVENRPKQKNKAGDGDDRK